MALLSNNIDLKEPKSFHRIKSERYGLWIGPHYNSRGGVCSVIRTYYNEGFFDDQSIRFLASVSDGSKLHKFLTFIKAFAFVFLNLKELLFIHIHLSSNASFWRKSIFILLASTFKVPVIIHLHASGFVSFFYGSDVFKKRYIRYTFTKASQILVLSREMELFVKKLNINIEPVIFPNPITLHPAKQPVYAKQNTILFLGRIVPEKGIAELIEATQLVAQQIPDIRLIIGGDGNMDLLYQLIQKYKVKDNIELKGWLNDLQCQALMQECTLLVLSSHNEGQSMTLLDAMQSSLPIITTSVGGNTYIIEHLVTGILVPPKDAAALANAILLALNNRDLRERLASAAKQKVERVFDSKKVVARMLQAYTNYKLPEMKECSKRASIA